MYTLLKTISMRFPISLVLLLVFPGLLRSQSDFSLVPIISGLQRPVDIAQAGDARLFIVEQAGRIRILDGNRNLLASPFLDIQNRVENGANEQGLLGLAFDPDYAQNGHFFVNYTRSNDSTVIARFTVDPANPNEALADSEVRLLTIYQPFTNHNAGDLAFGPDGFLYIPTGDGGSGNDPRRSGQDGQSLLGKILRIDPQPDGSYRVPADNPFIANPEFLDEIWSYGLRNPWRISFDRQTGELWIADVGQDAREEINVQAANSTGAENYGWRCFEGTLDLFGNECASDEVITFPIHEYSHDRNGASVTGGFVYRGTTYPDLVGRYFYGDIVLGRIWSLTPDGNGGFENRVLLSDGIGVSTFGEDAAGELYLAELSGTIYRLQGSPATSTNSPNPLNALRVYPNPATGPVTLEVNTQKGNLPIEWQLYGSKGELITAGMIYANGLFPLDLGRKPSGLYWLQLNSQAQGRTIRLMVP